MPKDKKDFDYPQITKIMKNNYHDFASEYDFIKNIQKFYIGVSEFKDHPYRRIKKNYIEILNIGLSRLFDYGMNQADSDVVFLLIPSLINKSYILDLKKNLSLIDYLVSQNIYTYLVDWGEPEANEVEFSFNDYITERILVFIEKIYQIHKKKIILGGYCLGGLMAIASASLYKKYIHKVALIAVPWDFSKIKNFDNIRFLVENLESDENINKIPAAAIQTSFCLFDPEKIFHKFIKFADSDKKSKIAENFVAIEQWLNDGISITRKVAMNIIKDFSKENICFKNKWKINNKIIKPDKLKINFFVALPLYDEIVPYNSSLALAAILVNKEIVRTSTGHIGMIVGSRAKEELWIKLAKWLKNDSNIKFRK